MNCLTIITKQGTRLEKLKTLADILAEQIDQCEERKEMPALARQYRETIREIEEIEGTDAECDEISEILTQREHNGESGAVRKDRSKMRKV